MGKKKNKMKSTVKNLSKVKNNVGLGFNSPNVNVNGEYDSKDKKCPFSARVSIRGRILTGKVAKKKMKRTIIVRREYFHFVKKYQRYEKRHSNIPAHLSDCFKGVKKGQTVVLGQCRPLSKTVRFNVLRVMPGSTDNKKTFNVF